MKKLISGFAAVCFFNILFAQTITPQQYIQDHKDLAIREMKRMGVPAAITLAQGLLETESGNSDLVKKSNNHFGIKCKSTWTAESVSHDDDAPGECFRTYKDAEGSYRDHSNYLRGNDRYAPLFKLDPRDYKGWAYGLKKAGYATNPRYPDILIKNIEDNNLEQYTLVAVNDVPFFDASKYQNDPEEKAFNDITKARTASAVANNAMAERVSINGLKAIYESKGRSLLAIATENNINLNKLLEFNDLQNDGLLNDDQYIFLEKKSKEGDRDFYVVQKNESLYDVAQKNGIRLQSLYDYNNLKGDEKFAAGSKLNLRPSVKEPAVLVKDTPPLNNASVQIKKYEVQPHEGLYSISKKYGVTVAQLREWNNLPDDNLKVGQQLIISK